MTTTTEPAQQTLEDAFGRQSSGEIVEVLREVQSAQTPTTLSVLSLQNVADAMAAREALQVGSIQRTYPEDWVSFRTRDGARVGYLQDSGCERVRPIWGISFDRFDPLADMLEEILPDGHVLYLASVSGSCRITGEQLFEVGQRSSMGLFETAWEQSAERPVERAKLKMDVRKSAIANARGRLIRAFAGLASVPIPELQRAGLDISRVRGVEIAEGSQGGGGQRSGVKSGGPSQKQAMAIWSMACDRGGVQGLKETGASRQDWMAFCGHAARPEESKIAAGPCKLKGGRNGSASTLISTFQEQKEPIDLDTFVEATGALFVGGEGEGGDAEA